MKKILGSILFLVFLGTFLISLNANAYSTENTENWPPNSTIDPFATTNSHDVNVSQECVSDHNCTYNIRIKVNEKSCNSIEEWQIQDDDTDILDLGLDNPEVVSVRFRFALYEGASGNDPAGTTIEPPNPYMDTWFHASQGANWTGKVYGDSSDAEGAATIFNSGRGDGNITLSKIAGSNDCFLNVQIKGLKKTDTNKNFTLQYERPRVKCVDMDGANNTHCCGDPYLYAIEKVPDSTNFEFKLMNDNDFDGDGKSDMDDNCPNVGNTDQADLNNNKIGDACDISLFSPNKSDYQITTVTENGVSKTKISTKLNMAKIGSTEKTRSIAEVLKTKLKNNNYGEAPFIVLEINYLAVDGVTGRRGKGECKITNPSDWTLECTIIDPNLKNFWIQAILAEQPYSETLVSTSPLIDKAPPPILRMATTVMHWVIGEVSLSCPQGQKRGRDDNICHTTCTTASNCDWDENYICKKPKRAGDMAVIGADGQYSCVPPSAAPCPISGQQRNSKSRCECPSPTRYPNPITKVCEACPADKPDWLPGMGENGECGVNATPPAPPAPLTPPAGDPKTPADPGDTDGNGCGSGQTMNGYGQCVGVAGASVTPPASKGGCSLVANEKAGDNLTYPIILMLGGLLIITIKRRMAISDRYFSCTSKKWDNCHQFYVSLSL